MLLHSREWISWSAHNSSRALIRQSTKPTRQIQKVSSNSVVFCRLQDGQEASEWEREEARWLREEKRWLREEERWLREEARWVAERKDLLEQTTAFKEEIKALKARIAELESQAKAERGEDGALTDLIVSLTRLLHSLNMAGEGRGSSFQAQLLSSPSTVSEIRTALGDISLEIPAKRIEMAGSVSQPSIVELKGAPPTTSSSGQEWKKRTLKQGMEGDDVKAMQEALAKLGFYSGEDDLEYSTFSSGTERAVRSWQATIGASENGIVTSELLLKLLGEDTPVTAEEKVSTFPSQVKSTSSVKENPPLSASRAKGADQKGNRAATMSPGKSTAAPVGSKTKPPTPEKTETTFVEPSRTRVYLLGENRWEEPDRLLGRNGPTASAGVVMGERCFACKGQGSMMCTECEGTGELNVEEQFLEWAEEGAKCPYCDGKGVLDCDVCNGKGVRSLS